MLFRSMKPAGAKSIPVPGTDGTGLANRFTGPMPAARHPSSIRRSSIRRNPVAALVQQPRVAGPMAGAPFGSAHPSCSSADIQADRPRRAIIPNRAVLAEREWRRAHRLAAVAEAAHRTRAAVAAAMRVAAEAITGRVSGGTRFFDFFPQARTSASQRVRALFFGLPAYFT